MKIFAERSFIMNCISIHMMDDTNPSGRYIAQPLTFMHTVEGTITPPCVELSATDAQQLMDQPWHCGMRPTEGTGSAGSLAATERHLADMRKLAMHALNVPA
jgi:hypothetical protein